MTAQDLNRLYQKAYSQENQGVKKLKLWKGNIGLPIHVRTFSRMQVKVVGIEGTFDQLWIGHVLKKHI